MKTLFLVPPVASGTLPGPSLEPAGAEAPYGTRDRPLGGLRCETLRALARQVDEAARGALEDATDEARQETSFEAMRILSSIRPFARRAHAFHSLMSNYQTLPFEVPPHVDDLTIRAREVNHRLRSARVPVGAVDGWEAVLDVLGRMRLLLAGRDVEVPAARVVSALSGSRLREFRELAHEVDASATRAQETAKADVEENPRGQQLLGELHHFADQSRDLKRHADAEHVDAQKIGPIVVLLLKEAREADRRIREARVFPSIWDESDRTVTRLQRMAGLLRPRQRDEGSKT